MSPGSQAASDQAATEARKTEPVAGDGRAVTGEGAAWAGFQLGHVVDSARPESLADTCQVFLRLENETKE